MCGGDKLYFFWHGVEKQTRMQIVGAFLQHLSVGAGVGVVRPQIIVYTGPGICPDFADVGKYCDPTAFTDAVTFGKDQLSRLAAGDRGARDTRTTSNEALGIPFSFVASPMTPVTCLTPRETVSCELDVFWRQVHADVGLALRRKVHDIITNNRCHTPARSRRRGGRYSERYVFYLQ